MQLDLGNAGKILADNVSVLAAVGAQLVKINLLIEVRVVGRALISLGIARVVEAAAVLVPVDAAAGRREIHARDGVR